jgi:hypothetical protein
MNLELYWGPKDGLLLDMPVTPDEETGSIRRPATLDVGGGVYRIELASRHPDKNPAEGVKYIGVFVGAGK